MSKTEEASQQRDGQRRTHKNILNDAGLCQIGQTNVRSKKSRNSCTL